MELGLVASGVNYNGTKDGKHKWDVAIGAYGIDTETTATPQTTFKVNYLFVFTLVRNGTITFICG